MMDIMNYKKHENEALDSEWSGAKTYGRVKAGTENLYFKKGLSWKYLPYSALAGIYRRVEEAKSSLGCCGGVPFDIQKLVLTGTDGETLQVLIGDGLEKEAEALFAALKEICPGLNFLKPGRKN